MPRNDQPFRTFGYNTDQFTDPVTGMTVHDDGTDSYTQPQTGVVYVKKRSINGWCVFNASNRIELIAGGPAPVIFLINPLTGEILLNPLTGEPLTKP